MHDWQWRVAVGELNERIGSPSRWTQRIDEATTYTLPTRGENRHTIGVSGTFLTPKSQEVNGPQPDFEITGPSREPSRRGYSHRMQTSYEACRHQTSAQDDPNFRAKACIVHQGD